MSFLSKPNKQIAEVRSRLSITHDRDGRTLRVGGLSEQAWIIFSYGNATLAHERGLVVENLSSNIRYAESITGVPSPPWTEINAAWDVARDALDRLDSVLPAVHRSLNLITVGVAQYLAMRERVHAWGGFTNERERLPHLLASLNEAEKKAVKDRIAGLPVL